MATRFTYFGFEYEILEDKNNEVALINALNAKGRVIIPKSVESGGKTYVVTKIGSERVKVKKQAKDYRWIVDYETYRGPFTEFQEQGKDWYKIYGTNTTITSIVLPETIRELGFGAFRMCDALKDLNLPKGITKIEDRVFSGCKSLKNIILPDGITSIGKYAFVGCESLHEITIPSSVKSIDEKAFTDSNRSKCGLEKVNIMNDEGNIIIHPEAFTDRVKISYLGSKGIKQKSTSIKDSKEQSVIKSASIDLEKLIEAALVDGVVTDKERAILCKKVKEAGGDVDEFEMLLDARIYEAQQKAKPATPKAEPKKEEPKPEPKKDEPKPAPAKPASASSADGKMTVAQLAAEFKAQFGSVLRIYNGRSKADDSLSLQEVGLTGNLALPFDGNQKVGDFIAQMEKAGLKVKVYTCDEWVACLDGLTLIQTGQVKKSATKADMEKML